MLGFARAAESIAIDVFIANELTRILNESQTAVRTERRRESATFQREPADINTDKNRLVDLLMARTLDEPSYKAPLQCIRDRRNAATRNLAKANEEHRR